MKANGVLNLFIDWGPIYSIFLLEKKWVMLPFLTQVKTCALNFWLKVLQLEIEITLQVFSSCNKIIFTVTK